MYKRERREYSSYDVFLILTGTGSPGAPDGQFNCDSSLSLTLDRVCNGVDDCVGTSRAGSDETNILCNSE